MTAPWPDVRINCPFCGDGRGRLYIAIEDGPDEKKGAIYCQNDCKNSITFYQMFRDLENITDAEAMEQLYSEDPEPMYGKASDRLYQYLNPEQKPAFIDTNPPLVWPQNYVALYGLTPQEFAAKVPKYMLERKLDQAMCNRYYLGYCTAGKYGGRVIVPIYQHGGLVGFQARMMVAKPPKQIPKYLFMEGIKAGDYLYNLDAVPAQYDECILTEGIFDVWGMVRHGFPNTVASFGKHLTEKGRRTLLRRFKSVLIFWDMDAKPEIIELAEMLGGYNMPVRVSFMEGKDPDEATTADVQAAMQAAQPYSRIFKRIMLRERLTATK